MALRKNLVYTNIPTISEVIIDSSGTGIYFCTHKSKRKYIRTFVLTYSTRGHLPNLMTIKHNRYNSIYGTGFEGECGDRL